MPGFLLFRDSGRLRGRKISHSWPVKCRYTADTIFTINVNRKHRGCWYCWRKEVRERSTMHGRGDTTRACIMRNRAGYAFYCSICCKNCDTLKCIENTQLTACYIPNTHRKIRKRYVSAIIWNVKSKSPQHKICAFQVFIFLTKNPYILLTNWLVPYTRIENFKRSQWEFQRCKLTFRITHASFSCG